MAKFRKKYNTGGPVSYNGNPVINQSTTNPYQQNIDQNYNVQNAPNNQTVLSQASQEQLAQNQQNKANVGAVNALGSSAAASGALGNVGAGMGWLGMATAASGLGKSFISKDQYGNPEGKTGQAANEILTPDHEQMLNDIGNKNWSALAWDSTGMGKFGRMTSQLTGNAEDKTGFWGGVNKMLGTPQKPIEEQIVTPEVYNKDYQQDAAWQKLNNQTQQRFGGKLYAMGGDLTQYEGYKHEMGGIPLGNINEVEAGETRGPNNSPDLKDYIYSDKLRVPGKKHTFAKMSKMIESKHSKRDNDKLSAEQKERELKGLMESQEQVRMSMMERAYKKAYGGCMNKMATGGEIPVNGFDPNTLIHTLKQGEKPYTNDQLLAMGYQIGNSTGEYITPTGDYAFYKPQYAQLGVTATSAPVEPNKVGLSKPKPNLSWPTRTDYSAGSVGPRYQNTLPEMKFGGKMQYINGGTPDWMRGSNYYDPQMSFEEQARLASENSGNPLLAPQGNPYAFDNTTFNNNTKDYTNQMYNPNNIAAPIVRDTMRGASNYRVPNTDAPMETIGRSNNIPTLGTPVNTPDQLAPRTNPSIGSPEESRVGNNSFDPNSLYNAGNFMGGLYDIYRGLKGGDPVNYERAKIETINPDLVNYQPSRDIQRRDIKEGFRADQESLKNVNNPAEYRALMMLRAGVRDKTISDTIARSYENEINANTGLKNQGKYFNASSKNQGNQFNAQTQRLEADARQQEKDIASNTLGYGLTQTGEALAGSGRDKRAYISQEESKRFIGSADFSPVREKGKTVGYKHKATGKTYLIEE